MPVASPDRSPKQELARKMFDAILSGVPIVGGPLAALYSVTHPAKGDIDQERWQQQVSNLLNSVEEAVNFLSQSIVLSEDATTLGQWISENSADAYANIFTYDEIVAQFPDASKNEILEAVGELELEGMVSLSLCLGKPFSHIRATHQLYQVFDPIVFPDANPRVDAALVAERLLASEDGISAPSLADELGWDVRRMNPALAIVGEFVADGRKSQPMGQPFVIRSMFLDTAERAQLRRFVNEIRNE